MSNIRTSYKEGDPVGDSGVLFISDYDINGKPIPPKRYNNGKPVRQARFLCPVCKNPYGFISRIDSIKQNRTVKCNNCKRQMTKEKFTIKYNKGDFLDAKKAFIYIEDAGRDNSGHRLAKVQSSITKEFFIVRIDKIKTGIIINPPSLQDKRYFVGCTLGPLNNIIFIEDYGNRYTSGGNPVRYGKFYNVDTQTYFTADINIVVAGTSQGISKVHYSQGELIVAKILKQMNIPFEKEYTFDDCLSPKGYFLKFDFFLPTYNCCIEYDGLQHYKNIFNFSDEDFQYRKICDDIKDKYCKNNYIRLIRIPYFEIDKLDSSYILNLLY